MSIPKVIVSHGRAGQMLTNKWLPSAAICVSESQMPLYREHYPDAEYIVHPDELKGLLPKRQWLYERMGDVFQLDDDLGHMGSAWHAPGEKQVKATGDYAESLIDRLHDEAVELGVYLFGFSNFVHPAAYVPQRPYRLTGVVYGLGFGIRAGSGLYWHPQLRLNGDFWISALNAYKHRMILLDTRWAFAPAKTFKLSGGLAGQRTLAAEMAAFDLLRETFGTKVFKARKNTPLSSKQFSNQLALNLPF